MGVYLSCRGMDFRIPRSNQEDAVGVYNVKNSTQHETLEDVYDELGFAVYADDPQDSEYAELGWFEGEKLTTWLEDSFRALAPFVEEDSYIEWEADDDIFRWVFRGGEMEDITATISWE